MSEPPKQSKKRSTPRQARAMTRAIDRVSDEFIEAFSQSGLDDGPEKPQKAEPVRQALLEREAREKKELEAQNTPASAQPKLKGLGSLLSAANKKPTGNFARVLDSEPKANEQKEAGSQTDSTTQVDSAQRPMIKVHSTSGKKRGLYTSYMQRPDEAQMQAWAQKAAEQKQIEQKEADTNRSVLHKLATTSDDAAMLRAASRPPIITPSAPPTNSSAAAIQRKASQGQSAGSLISRLWQRLKDTFAKLM